MTKAKAQLVTYGGQPIPTNGTATLDGNYPVTITAVRAPSASHDKGSVTVRYSWGDIDTVDPARLDAYISV